MKTIHHFLGVACAIFVMDIGSRADDQIRTYTVPKEHPAVLAAQDAAAPPAATADIPVNAAPVHYTLPSGWQRLAPDGVRLVNIAVPGKNGNGATVAITSFPGQVGTEYDNVNRWRGQLGLPQVTGTDITSEPVIVDGTESKLYDISGATARIVVVVDRREGATWFIKMNGDSGTVADAKPAFIDFVKSIHFAAAATAAELVAPDGAADATSPRWSVPSNWSKTAPGPMIYRSFSVGDNAGHSGAVTVSFFPGDVGGELRNVNRWRTQMELPEVEDIHLNGLTENIEVSGGKGLLVDFTGGGSKAGKRLVAAIVPHGDNTWFYKLVGDNAIVATEKDGFVNFVKNVQYP